MAGKTISVDLCGTIADCKPYDRLWYELFPRLYSDAHGVSFESAKEILVAEYARVGPQRVEWYSPSFWLRRFGISEQRYLKEVKKEIKVELPREVYELSRESRLILSTNVSMEVLKLTVDLSPFAAVYSSVEMGRARKDSAFWQEVIRAERGRCWPFVHLGDDYVYDYLYPASLGIMARLAPREVALKILRSYH